MVSQIESLGLIALAIVLGGVVGVERELAQKPAGLRTHMLVAAAAAMMMLLGDAVIDSFRQLNSEESINADPIRIIQAVVVGISFLGAGTIAREKCDEIEGLTTAASILLTAAIGIAVAVRLVWLAIGVVILAVLVLALVGFVESKFKRVKDTR